MNTDKQYLKEYIIYMSHKKHLFEVGHFFLGNGDSFLLLRKNNRPNSYCRRDLFNFYLPLH